VGDLIQGAFDTAAEREELVRNIVSGVLVAVALYAAIRFFGVKVR